MPSIFLTGASGHLGGYVLNRLLENDCCVYALVRNALSINSSSPNLHIIQGDLKNLSACKDVIKNADGIIHLASSRSLDRETVLSVDLAAVNQLTDYWQRGPFLYASSQVVYGQSTKN